MNAYTRDRIPRKRTHSIIASYRDKTRVEVDGHTMNYDFSQHGGVDDGNQPSVVTVGRRIMRDGNRGYVIKIDFFLLWKDGFILQESVVFVPSPTYESLARANQLLIKFYMDESPRWWLFMCCLTKRCSPASRQLGFGQDIRTVCTRCCVGPDQMTLIKFIITTKCFELSRNNCMNNQKASIIGRVTSHKRDWWTKNVDVDGIEDTS